MSSEPQTEPRLQALELGDDQETELRRLLCYYKREAERCKQAKAYLAGCVMAGSELETSLMLMISAYPDDVLATNAFPRRKDGIKPLLEWSLAELIRVAEAADWLPAALEYGKDDWDGKKAKIGDHAEVVRGLRNLAHPARYMQDHYRRRITKKYLGSVLDTIDGVISWLFARIETSVLQRVKEDKERSQVGHTEC